MTQSIGDSQRFIGKKVFLEKESSFLGNKTVEQPFGANLKKNVFFAKFCCKFLAFLKFCSTKNAENYYFNQRL